MVSVLPRHPLARDIAVVLMIKIVLILLASVFLFPEDRRLVVNPEIMAKKLFDADNAVNNTAVQK